MSNRRTRRAKLHAAVFAAANLAALPCAGAELLLDLRVAGGGKSALVQQAGDVVNLELYALVRDANANPADNGLNATQGAFTSGNGGLKGNIAASLPPAYAQFGSANPAPADLDGDGDMDVGALPAASSGFWIASAGVSGTFGSSSGVENIGGVDYKAWLIGTATFTAGDVQSCTTQLSYQPRIGDANLGVYPHKYYADGGVFTSILATDVRLSLGEAVTVTRAAVWNGGMGAWETAANWSAGLVPGSACVVQIDASKPAASTVTLTSMTTVGGLTIDGGDTLLVNAGGRLVINYTGSSPAATIRGYLAGGCNGGLWTGTGIASSDAASAGNTAVGWIDGGGAITVRYTLYGDATLDGTVNFADLLALSQNYNTSGRQWIDGDSDYDGFVNFADLLRLSQNYNQSLPSGAAAVPEPSALSVLGLSVLLLRRRRAFYGR